MKILPQIKSPNDIKKLSYDELMTLAIEIRKKIISTVSVNGGHLASNLGMVELSIALHRAFNAPKDKIIFDVGHQVYAHKLLTGRYDSFHTLRTYKGISGFPKSSESIYDAFEVGHASTSISAALGFARARDLYGDDNEVIAIIGDGALTGGLAYEALNDAGLANTHLTIILNDNEMSISKNVGAISIYLSKIRSSRRYRNAKKKIRRGIQDLPIIGKALHKIIHYVKQPLKKVLIKENFFTPLGFHYIGPIDGHNIVELEDILKKSKNYKEPLLIHIATKKGYGLKEAEDSPDVCHGIAPKTTYKNNVSCGKIAAGTLLELMGKHDNIVAITAAMDMGTSSNQIKTIYPQRYYDVGIAEEHAVTMAAGMAKNGLKPYFFVYSTFFQRAFDQMLHDVFLQQLPVTILLDRCCLSGEDGSTHHGIYDLAICNSLKNAKVYSAINSIELRKMVEYSYNISTPCIIRYYRNFEKEVNDLNDISFNEGKWQYIQHSNNDFYILSYGSIFPEIIKASKELKLKNINFNLINCSSIEPLDYEFLEKASINNYKLLIIEEHYIYTGLSTKISTYSNINNLNLNIKCIGIDDWNIEHGSRANLLIEAKLDFITLQKRIEDIYSEFYYEKRD